MSMPFRVMLVASLIFAAATAFAAPATDNTLTPQQQRMSQCSKQSAGKQGDARKTFMSRCLKGQGNMSGPRATQQQKMKSCNAEATTRTLKGDARKAFMSGCLKGKGGMSGPRAAQQQKMKSCNAEATTKALKGDARKAFMSSCLKG